jgi:hypothetical protein
MADMTPNNVSFSTGHQDNLVLLAGERIRIQVLNSDGSEKTLLTDQSVPTGKQAQLSVTMIATLSDAA